MFKHYVGIWAVAVKIHTFFTLELDGD